MPTYISTHQHHPPMPFQLASPRMVVLLENSKSVSRKKEERVLRFFFFSVPGCFACTLSVCHVTAQCPHWPEEGDGCPGAEITEGCELPGGCWKSNLGLRRGAVLTV